MEYIIHFDRFVDEVFCEIEKEIKIKFPDSQSKSDRTSLWVPSADPKWINFSIEKSKHGFFIVSNLNKNEADGVFHIMEKIFLTFNIDCLIEEV